MEGRTAGRGGRAAGACTERDPHLALWVPWALGLCEQCYRRLSRSFTIARPPLDSLPTQGPDRPLPAGRGRDLHDEGRRAGGAGGEADPRLLSPLRLSLCMHSCFVCLCVCAITGPP